MPSKANQVSAAELQVFGIKSILEEDFQEQNVTGAPVD